MKTDIITGASDILLSEFKAGNILLKVINSKILEDITQLKIKHLNSLMIEILSNYLNNTLSDSDVLDFIDSIQKVLYEKYTEDFPDTFYPRFQDSDERSIGINSIDTIRCLSFETNPLDKQDLKIVLNFLNASDALKAHKDLRDYLYKKYPKSKDWI
jgi:hypothetical protein